MFPISFSIGVLSPIDIFTAVSIEQFFSPLAEREAALIEQQKSDDAE